MVAFDDKNMIECMMCMIGMSNNKLLLNWRLKYETNYKNILTK